MADVISIFKKCGIKFEKAYGKDELEMDCPACGRAKHGYFNVVKKKFYCQRCKYGASFIYFLMIRLNISKERAREIISGKKEASVEGLRERIKVLSEKNLSEDFSIEDVFFKNPLPPGLTKITKKDFPIALAEREVSIGFTKKLEITACNSSGKFFNRLVFPITTLRTQTFVAVSALSQKNAKKMKAIYKTRGENFRKSLFPFGSFISETLYLYNRIKTFKGNLYIVEGVWDTLRLLKYGLCATATFGDKISTRQAELLSMTKAKRLFIMLDGDVPFKRLLEYYSLLSMTCFDKEVYLCILPKEKDPDDLSKEEVLTITREAMNNKLIQNRRGL